MEPIINPWIFYFADILNAFSILFTAIGIIGLFTSTIILITIFVDFDDGSIEARRLEKLLKNLLFICSTVLIIGVLLPTKETIYKMLTAKYLTSDNINLGIEQIKSMIDYIAEKLK